MPLPCRFLHCLEGALWGSARECSFSGPNCVEKPATAPSLILSKAPTHRARVSLVAPAGPLPEGGLDRAIKRVKALGWEPVVGASATARHGYLAGEDAARLSDLNDALSDPGNDMIWLLRGGYGTMRILPQVDFRPLIARPRPLVGFSDNTALHLAAHRLGVSTFHGPHPAAADLSQYSLDCLVRVLQPIPAGVLPPSPDDSAVETLVGGTAEGRLVGGNLALLAATTGTPFQMRAEGAILFLEDVGETAYRIDRMMTQLLLAGLFDRVAGVAVGAFSESPDAQRSDVPTPSAVILDRLRHLGVPVAYNFPFGHIGSSWTLPMGVRARLDASAGTLAVLESAVTE